MSKPKELRYELSRDAFNRVTELVWRRDYSGKTGFEIIRHELNQRDESERVSLLTVDQLIEMGEIARNGRAFRE